MSMIDRVVVVLGIAVVLTACGGGSGGGSVSQALNEAGKTRGQEATTTENDVTKTGSEENTNANSTESYSITGSGVKGPIAFGEVALYKLDLTSRQLYDTSNPIATGSTDQSAAITGLTIDSSIEPPFVIVIDGTRGIDLNTNRSPVIKRLINVVTQSHLSEGRAIYATPLTTMAFNMARKSRPQTAQEFLGAMSIAATEIKAKLGFGMSNDIDILNDPPIMTAQAKGASGQQLVVEHRAALEALAAVTNQMSTPMGKGLKGEYFDNVDLTGFVFSRVDPTVYFNWGRQAPGAGIDPETFSVRWSGFVQPKYSETYTFYTDSDDGVRVWVNNQLIIDNWTDHGVTENSGQIALAAGDFYPIRVEYYDSRWDATIMLKWSSTSQSVEAVASEYLFSDDASTFRNINPDIMLEKLSDDLSSDGIVDGVVDGESVTEIDMDVLQKDPNTLKIANTNRTVGDMAKVMEEELQSLALTVDFKAKDVRVQLQIAQRGVSESNKPSEESEGESSGTSTTTTTTTSSSTTSTTQAIVTTTTTRAIVATTTTRTIVTTTTSTRATTSTTSASTSTTTRAPTTSTTTTTNVVRGSAFEAKYNPGHYMLIWPDSTAAEEGEAIDIANSVFTGIQGRYSWRELEPSKGVYDFSKIEKDLAYLQSVGKRLVIQFETTRWASTALGFPQYLVSAEYAGGYFRRKSGVAIAKKYNEKVSARIEALMTALGARFDREPYVEAIVAGETSLGVTVAQDPSTVTDYTVQGWKTEIKAVMSAAKRAFPNTTVIQYINYLDRAGEQLVDIVNHAKAIGVGIGGPDITPYDEAAMRVHYKYYPDLAGQVPLGTAVQWVNYTAKNPMTQKTNTVTDILEFGVDELHLNYFFWVIRSPYFLRDVVPLLEQRNAPINR